MRRRKYVARFIPSWGRKKSHAQLVIEIPTRAATLCFNTTIYLLQVRVQTLVAHLRRAAEKSLAQNVIITFCSALARVNCLGRKRCKSEIVIISKGMFSALVKICTHNQGKICSPELHVRSSYMSASVTCHEEFTCARDSRTKSANHVKLH